MSNENLNKKKLNEILKTKIGNKAVKDISENRSYSNQQKAISVTKPPQALLDRLQAKPKNKK